MVILKKCVKEVYRSATANLGYTTTRHDFFESWSPWGVGLRSSHARMAPPSHLKGVGVAAYLGQR